MTELFNVHTQKDPELTWKEIGEVNQLSLKTSISQFDLLVLNGILKITQHDHRIYRRINIKKETVEID